MLMLPLPLPMKTDTVKYQSENEWRGIPELGAVFVEQKLLELLAEMLEWGKTKAAGEVPTIALK